MNDHEAIMEVLSGDLPDNVRVMNVGAVTEEIIYGRDETGDDIGEHIYDRFEKALDEMVDEGILNTGEAFGEKIYGITPAWQERHREQALHYFRNLSKLTKRQEEEAEGNNDKRALTLGHRACLLDELLRELETDR